MSRNDWEQTLDELKQDIAAIKGRAGALSMKFEEVLRQAELLKVAFLNHILEEQIMSVARTRGYTSIMRDKKRLGASLGAAAAGLILGGIITKDKFAAASAGLSSFDAVLQGFGETACAVSLGKDLRVIPIDNVTSGKTWVTWESLKTALACLESEASQGVKLGNLDSIIVRLRKRKEIIYLGLLIAKPIQLERGEL